MKTKKILILLSYLLFYIFSFSEQNKYLIMEIEKLNLSGFSTRQKINIYNNGEIEDIMFYDNEKISYEYFKIKNLEYINFINNISLEAINSVRNDKFKFFQNFHTKNNKISNKELTFDYKGYEQIYNEIEQSRRNDYVIFNGKLRKIDYIQRFSNSEKKLSYIENNMSIYKIRYKDKVFFLSNYKKDYKNNEIRKIIDLFSVPFFEQYKVSEIELYEKNKENELASELEIEKINFNDKNKINYIKYIFLKNNKFLKISYQNTDFVNQFKYIQEELYITQNEKNKMIEEIKDTFSRAEGKELEYTLEINNGEFLRNKLPVFVNYNNILYKNPLIFKIYSRQNNIYFSIIGNNDIKKIISKMEKFKTHKSNLVFSWNYSNKDSKDCYDYSIIDNRYLDMLSELKTEKELQNHYKFIDNEDFYGYDIDNDDYQGIVLKDFIILEKNFHNLNEISKKLKKNWKYKGATIDEIRKNTSDFWKKLRNKK